MKYQMNFVLAHNKAVNTYTTDYEKLVSLTVQRVIKEEWDGHSVLQRPQLKHKQM